MDMAVMRSIVFNAYDGIKWHQRVNNMPDRQIQAVYYNLKRSGRLDKKAKKSHKKEHWVQLTLFDVGMEEPNNGTNHSRMQ